MVMLWAYATLTGASSKANRTSVRYFRVCAFERSVLAARHARLRGQRLAVIQSYARLNGCRHARLYLLSAMNLYIL